MLVHALSFSIFCIFYYSVANMYLIRVAPIGRGIFKNDLHYFSSENIPLGALVSVTVRHRIIPGLVLEITAVSDAKTAIKSYPYSIKKIDNVKAKEFLLPEFMELAHETSHYYAGTLGGTLSALVPHTILERGASFANSPHSKNQKNAPKQTRSRWEGTIAIQGTDKERLIFYKSRVREGFARHMSVFLCLPTVKDIEHFIEQLERGIHEFTIPLHGKLSKTQLYENWKRAVVSSHPVLIVGTGAYLSVPRKDIGIILMDKESSPAYKTMTRPYLDYRYVAKLYAKKKNASLVVGDVVLRTETVYEKESGNCHSSSKINYHVLSRARTTIVDMTKYKERKPFAVLSDESIEAIQNALNKKERVFVFAHRKGLSTFTACDDCGTTQLCDTCNSPLVLYKKNEETIFVCHKCGTHYESKRLCNGCGGWRLTALGVGINRVEDALKKQFPKNKLFIIDAEHVQNHKNGKAIIEKFLKTSGSILLGTEMSFFYLYEPTETVIVASIDSFFSLPDFRIKERALNILMRAKTIAKNTFIVQTRNADWSLFEYIRSGNLVNFYRDEIEERSMLKYPPFSTLIKITLSGEYKIILETLNQLKEYVKPYNAVIYPAFTKKIKGKNQAHLLLKLKHGQWPDEKLHKKLKGLPPEFRVVVDPSDLL